MKIPVCFFLSLIIITVISCTTTMPHSNPLSSLEKEKLASILQSITDTMTIDTSFYRNLLDKELVDRCANIPVWDSKPDENTRLEKCLGMPSLTKRAYDKGRIEAISDIKNGELKIKTSGLYFVVTTRVRTPFLFKRRFTFSTYYILRDIYETEFDVALNKVAGEIIDSEINAYIEGYNSTSITVINGFYQTDMRKRAYEYLDQYIYNYGWDRRHAWTD